ncbi:kinase-like domain-containing protein [Rhizophagus irregularis DAOM 181602=DAOM 197198]|nr:kinase-like domain-containing protein [Rhizophagus irregularis DAOM 181602=DAOM 197198]
MDQIVEWIEYDKFEDVEYLAKGGFGTTFKAIWKDGHIIYWDYNNNQWKRKGETKVALKCLYNSQNITTDFLKEVESNIIACSLSVGFIVRCFDPLKRPKADELWELLGNFYSRIHYENDVINRQIKEIDEINKKSSFSIVQSPSSSTSTLLYTTHPQAVYTSKLLDFKNLPEPKNAVNDDLEYSDSLRMDFTKLDIKDE